MFQDTTSITHKRENPLGSNESENCSVMSSSLWPHGLYSPRNSLGQNTGVRSLSLLQWTAFCQTTLLWPVHLGWPHMAWPSCSFMSNSLRPHGLYSPWNSPGQNIGVSSLSLLQGIVPTQGLNPGLLHCKWVLYQLSHKERPRILEQ